MFKSRAIRMVVALGAIAAGLTTICLPAPLLQFSGYELLSHQAESVVDDVTEQNFAAFVAISAVKTALAIIEDSSIGVGFQLEVGDAVQAVYDYVDLVWEVLLYSLLVLGGYKLLLETQLLHLGLQLTGIGLALWGIGVLVDERLPVLRRAAPRVVFGGVLIAYIVPIALLLMHFSAAHYTGPVKQQQAERIDALQAQVEKLRAQLVEIKGDVDLLQPVESLGAIRQRMAQVTARLVDTVNTGAQAMLYYAVIVLFELLVFPMLSAYLLFKLLHAFFGRMMDHVTPLTPVQAA